MKNCPGGDRGLPPILRERFFQRVDKIVSDAAQYCRTCGGQRTGRVEYDENDEVVEWLRYEMEGV